MLKTKESNKKESRRISGRDYMLKMNKGALLGYNSDKWHDLETATQNRQNGNERQKDGLKL